MISKFGKHLILIGGAVLGIAVLLLHYKQRDSYRCQTCFSAKSVYQWRVGGWSALSIPLTPSWQRITETHFQHDFFSSNHVHDWAFAQGSPYYFFGTKWGGCAIGAGRHVSDVCQMYESNSRFRAFIAQRLREGSLSTSNLFAMAAVERPWEPSPLREQAEALLDAFSTSDTKTIHEANRIDK